MTCPICQAEFDEQQSKSLPFCSPRCKQIDFGRWLGEEYSLPIERDEDDGDPASVN
ncbi:MAG: DNA gyrase inhibitor YacG [Planctomycetes bacterium]|nr:DNA gyrase inhibitor YacG [Planctomycetota bacterium]